MMYLLRLRVSNYKENRASFTLILTDLGVASRRREDGGVAKTLFFGHRRPFGDEGWHAIFAVPKPNPSSSFTPLQSDSLDPHC